MDLKKKISNELSKKSLKDRFDPKTTAPFWRKVRNVSGVVASIGGLVLIAPVSLPTSAVDWISWITTGAGILAGRAHLNKSNK